MIEIERFDMRLVGTGFYTHEEMQPNADGDWVRYDDHKKALIASAEREGLLRTACEKVIEFNRQRAKDEYGDAEKAESWACVRTLRAALNPLAHTPREDKPA